MYSTHLRHLQYLLRNKIGAVGGRLSAVGGRLSALGFGLWAIGCWLLVFGCRLSAIRYSLFAKKITTIAAITLITYHSSLITHKAMAQRSSYVRIFQEHYEDKPIHYGFFFALPVTRFNLTHADAFNAASDSANAIRTPQTTNFRMGFVINSYLNDRFDIRTTPSVSLYNRLVEYEMRSGRVRTETRESAWMEFPVLLKYKSQRRVNSRMYVYGGATFGFETNVRKKVPAGVNRLAARTNDLTLDYGFGFEQFLQYTKFTPEIRFSHGLLNHYVEAKNPATLGIKKLTSHTITLYLMFE